MLRTWCVGSGGRCVLGLAGLMAAGVTSASAQPMGVTVDQFMHTVDQLPDARSGHVFWNPVSPAGSPWYQSPWYRGSFKVASDGLTYTDAASGAELATAGGRATLTPAGPFTYVEAFNFQWHWPNYPLTAGTTFWGSALVRAEPGEEAQVGLLVCNGGCRMDEGALWIGKRQSWGWAIETTNFSISEVLPEPSTPVALLLYRVESTATGAATVSVWLNPPLQGELPPPLAVVTGWNMGPGVLATGLRAGGLAEPSIDEVRLGPTAASVLPLKSFTWATSAGGAGQRYEVVATSTPITWTQARDAAQAMGGRLADINSPQEHDAILEHVMGRDDVWHSGTNERGFTDFRGPWIGAQRQDAHLLEHQYGWEWVGGQPWSFADWATEAVNTNYLAGYEHAVPIIDWRWTPAEGWIPAVRWMPTTDAGFDRIRGYVVEYPALPVGPAVPDVVIAGELPYSVTVTATLPPGSTGLQWRRRGVPLTDGLQSNYQTISGSTTNQLTIQGLNLDGLGEYEIQAIDSAGMPLSHRGRIRIDATQQSFVTCSYGMPIYRVFIAPSGAVTSEQARQHAASLGGRLATSDWIQHQQVIDAMTCDEALHTADSRPFAAGPVGPWIGGVKTEGTYWWWWPNGAWVSGGGPWAPGMPRSLWEWDPAASMHLTPAAPGSSSMLWADMFASEEASSTLPNSYVVEWASAFEEPAEVIPVEGDCGGELALEVTLAAHGVGGSFLWTGPAGFLQDGTTPNGTVVSGSSTSRLELSPLAPGDAGYYFPIFVTPGGCGLQGAYFHVTVGECGTSCPADFNQDGGIDGGDIDAFFAAWEAGDGAADVNQDGGVDFGDVDTFFTAWENGGC